MNKQVYIRVDGNSEIGLGHLIRCIALAHMIKGEFTTEFISKEVPDKIYQDIIDQDFLISKIGSEKEFLSRLQGNEIVVLDHYELYDDYQKIIKKKGNKLVCIDDLHDKYFFADLIINHAPGISPKHYSAQSYTKFALGLDYALLRPEFLDSNAKRGNEIDNTVFICFGGSDKYNLTMNALKAVLAHSTFGTINVVVGHSYLYYQELSNFSQDQRPVCLYKGVNAEMMVELMSKSDVAIVPSSGILLEALSTNLKVISGMYVENQQFIYKNYKKAGTFLDAKDFSFENILMALKEIKNFNLPKNKIIDKKSGKRILRLFKLLNSESHVH